MNSRIFIASFAVFLTIAFMVGVIFVRQGQSPVSSELAGVDPVSNSASLVRFHSPVIGPMNAPVTVVEFFDPSCEGCRAFHPHVKQLMKKYPDHVRVVIRYVLFHSGSKQVVRMLEAARSQGVFEPVLDALLQEQPRWHDDPELKAAWQAATRAGLDEKRARREMSDPSIDAILKADEVDVTEFRIKGTPTFFVNGKRLTNHTPQALLALVEQAISESAR